MNVDEFYNSISSLYSKNESRIIFNELMHYEIDIETSIERLLQNEPLAYIVNKCIFLGKELLITKDTLIPRPETEELVELLIKTIDKSKSYRILDIGTGSGCIALYLACALPHCTVTAIDISKEALQVARHNFNKYQLNIECKVLDILDKNSWSELGQYDIIVSNPPYIASKEKNTMSKNVLNFEPYQALFVDDTNPLIFYDTIMEFSSHYLSHKGQVFFETSQYYPFQPYMNFDSQLLNDYSGNQRFAIFTKRN